MPSEPRSTNVADSGCDAPGPEFSLHRKIGLLLGSPFFLVLLWPALTSGLNEGGRRLLATSGLMAFWWITEAIPIPASCAFMLPVATPPNAIVFASGYVTVPQMAHAGIWLNLIGVVLVTAILYLFVVPVFQIDFSFLPSWVR